MRATRLDAPLQLDGQLDERVYRDIEPVTDFIQQEPDEGAPATDQTEVWVMFDGDTLYVAARCWSADPDRIVANEMKRDSRGFSATKPSRSCWTPSTTGATRSTS